MTVPQSVAIAEASATTGRRVHMHLFETRRQRDWARRVHPRGLLRHLDAIGLLSPRLTVAHAVWLNAADCALLAERGVTVSVNVSSNLRLPSGIPPWRRLIDAGVAFGLGLDGMSLDDDEDMLREMRLAWHLMRTVDGDRRFGLGAFLEAVCRHGRRSVTDDDKGGALAPGFPADLLVIDTKRLARDRLVDDDDRLLDLVIGRATRGDIAQLVIAGRLLVQQGRCVSVDLPGLENRLTAEAREAVLRTPADTGAIERLGRALRQHLGCGCR